MQESCNALPDAPTRPDPPDADVPATGGAQALQESCNVLSVADAPTQPEHFDVGASAGGRSLQDSCKAPSLADASVRPDQFDVDGAATSQALGLRESCNGPGPRARPVRGRPGPTVTGEDPCVDGEGALIGGGSGEDGEAAAGARKRLAWRKTSPAHLLIIASHDLLTGVPGAAPARLGDGTMIPADSARRFACEAALTRVVLDAEAEPLELGRTTRLFSTAQVRALIARDQGCRWPGCDVPAVACTPHHVTWWTNAGTTDIGNGALLCPVHHRMVHEDHWQLTRAPDQPRHPAHRSPHPLDPPLHSPPPHTHLPTAA